MQSAFVTGGTGFVGSHLVEHLLERGCGDVRCLVRSDDPKWLEGLPVTLVRGSLDDPESLREATRDVEYVFHVAGLTRSRDYEAFRAANVTGTYNLLGLLAERPTPPAGILVTSSLAAIGACDQSIADEDTPFRPVSLYGRSKAEMEEGMGEWFPRMPIVVVRPPAVYGPRDADILTFFQAVARGLCPMVGDPDQPAVSLVHAKDLVRGMTDAVLAPNAAGNTYFVGSERPYSWAEVRDAAAAALERRVFSLSIPPALVLPIGALSEWMGRLTRTYPALNIEKAREIRDACTMCSSERAMQDFGYREHIPLNEGVAQTIRWYREQGWL